MKRLYPILLSLLFCIQFSCTHDSLGALPGDNDDEVEVAVDPGAVRSTDNFSDSTIVVFRVLAFDHNKGMECTYNFYYGYASDTIFRFLIKKGTYDFVFIANEISDEDTSRELQKFHNESPVRTLANLEHLIFPHTAFAVNKHIPMSAIERGVTVKGDTLYDQGGNQYHRKMPVKMERLAVRLDLELTTELIAAKNNFTGITLKNIPESVSLLAYKENGDSIFNRDLYSPIPSPAANTTERTVLRAEGKNNDWEEYIENSVTKYRWSKERIIIPSSVFSGRTQKEKAIMLHVDIPGKTVDDVALGLYTPYTEEVDPITGIVILDNINYTLPRNTRVSFTGELVDSDIILNTITVNPWDGANNVGIED